MTGNATKYYIPCRACGEVVGGMKEPVVLRIGADGKDTIDAWHDRCVEVRVR